MWLKPLLSDDGFSAFLLMQKYPPPNPIVLREWAFEVAPTQTMQTPLFVILKRSEVSQAKTKKRYFGFLRNLNMTNHKKEMDCHTLPKKASLAMTNKGVAIGFLSPRFLTSFVVLPISHYFLLHYFIAFCHIIFCHFASCHITSCRFLRLSQKDCKNTTKIH